MRIISANVNGIRAAEKKGFFNWLAKQRADVVCIQETKAQFEQLDPAIFCPKPFHCYYFDAQKKAIAVLPSIAVMNRIMSLKALAGHTATMRHVTFKQTLVN